MIDAPRPVLPTVTDLNRPFWEAAGRGELTLQRCSDCGHLLYPIAPLCPRCLGEHLDWERLSGHGTIFSLVVFRRGYHPWWAERVPYSVALVELDEGPRMFGDLPEDDPEELAIGGAVEAFFPPVTPELTIPRFRAVDGAP